MPIRWQLSGEAPPFQENNQGSILGCSADGEGLVRACVQVFKIAQTNVSIFSNSTLFPRQYITPICCHNLVDNHQLHKRLIFPNFCKNKEENFPSTIREFHGVIRNTLLRCTVVHPAT